MLPLVALALLAALPSAPPRKAEETKISIDLKDTSVVDVVRLMAEVGGLQVVVGSEVSCRLTLKLKDVPWRRVMDIALKTCGLGSEEDNGIVRVAAMSRLTQEAADRRKLAEEQALSGPLRIKQHRLSYARAEEMAPLLRRFLSPRGEVVVDARTNTVIIIDVDQ
jgi:type II secretory pathway component HofQ